MSDASNALAGPKGLMFAHDTIDVMGGYAIPPDPQNYELWLTYRLGENAQLSEAIDTLLEGGARINQALSRSLYDRYLAGDAVSAQIMMAGDQIAQELGSVVSTLSSAGDRTGAYGATLRQAVARMEQGLDTQHLREVLSGLAAATVDMAENTKGLHERLSEASQEIVHLRDSLAKARAESLTDVLTGLANRRYFDEVLKMRIQESQRLGAPLALLLCDIDHFKRVNDTWGHQTGDQVIRFVAGVLQRHALPDYLVARYGGEEFAVVMPRTQGQAALEFAENIRRAVEGKKLLRKSTNEDLGRITVSCGVALLASEDTEGALLERSDRRLYAAKRAGRNHVITDMDGPFPQDVSVT